MSARAGRPRGKIPVGHGKGRGLGLRAKPRCRGLAVGCRESGEPGRSGPAYFTAAVTTISTL